VILVGNKSDLNPVRAVPMEEAIAYAERNNLAYVETSGFDSSHVQQAFNYLLAELCLNVDLEPTSFNQHNEQIILLGGTTEGKLVVPLQIRRKYAHSTFRNQ
jgi:hypothetical protein